jgi:hypothetical protein
VTFVADWLAPSFGVGVFFMARINPLKSVYLCANGGPIKCRVTCDKCREIERHREYKSIKIPKVDPNGLYDLKIQRGKIIETKKALKVRCVKQEIEGVIIPQGFEVWLPNESIEGLVNV